MCRQRARGGIAVDGIWDGEEVSFVVHGFASVSSLILGLNVSDDDLAFAVVTFVMSFSLTSEYRGRLGDYSMLRDSDEVIYDYEPEPYGFRHVYVFVVVLTDHATCSCDRSNRISFVR